MSMHEEEQSSRLLHLVQQLLAIEETDAQVALVQAATLVAQALGADKADVFLYEQESQTLIAQGISKTALGHHQHSIGMHMLPIANGGRTVKVFQSGISYRNGRVQEDPEELTGVKIGLGIHSMVIAPLIIGGELRGVIQVDSLTPDFFTEQDQRFLEAVAHWVGTISHRAELLQRVARSAVEDTRRKTAEEMVTVLAHDLRNYLTPFQGRMGLLRRRAMREGRQQDLEDLTGMNTALKRLERLISNLMDTARLSQGLFTLTYQMVDLATLVQETATVLQTPSIEIEIHVPAGLVVWGDADRLQQALENLISNALQHSPDGTKVLVQAEMEEGGNSIQLSVSDNGTGIPEEILPSLFEPFHSGTGSRGLGIGLYLASQVALAHGGQLSVDKSYFQGARFLLTLPLNEANQEE